MAVGSDEAGWVHRWWRLLVAAAVALLAGLAIAVALSWHFSDRVLEPDHSNWSPQVQVEGLSPSRIVLERTEDTERPGVLRARVDGRAGDRRRRN